MARTQLGVAPTGHDDAARYGDVLGRLPYSCEDLGLLGWTGPPEFAAGTVIPTAGTLQMIRIKVQKTGTIGNLYLYVTTAGSTLTSGRCFMALFDSSKVRQQTTATMHTAWQSPGWVPGPITGVSVNAGDEMYVGWYWQGTTGPTFLRHNVTPIAAAINQGLSASNYRVATADTGLTTAMPSTAGTLASAGSAFVCAVGT